jgi:RsiW-degrading membrane proteinase PrsW (M82 family)
MNLSAFLSNPTAMIAGAVAVGVPLLFLYLVRRLDLYASGGFPVVVACFLAGIASFGFAFKMNTWAYHLLQAEGLASFEEPLSQGLLGILALFGLSGLAASLLIRIAVAPVIEEVGKSLALVIFTFSPAFTYFVDGAIYGFAAGTGFAVVENLFYVATANDQVGMAVNRVFSTALMHGSASALVGVALGRLRFGRGRTRFFSLLLGWLAAMALHIAFNRLVNNPSGVTASTLLMAIGVGFAGVATTAGFIFWGLREEREWLRETLGLDTTGVSAGESNIVQEMKDLGKLLEPLEAHFGTEKRKLCDRFIRLQAQLGIKTKAAALAESPALAAKMSKQADAIREEMDGLRREVGVYCMAYLRSILPPEASPMWEGLQKTMDERPKGAPAMNLWAKLGEKAEAVGTDRSAAGGASAETQDDDAP